jgi:hypothetical protein
LDSIVEGGGLEEILHWPPEVLYDCTEHARVEKRRKADMRAADLGFGRKSKQVWRAAVGRENVEWRGGNGCEIGSKEGV